jgi:hypothetical protein
MALRFLSCELKEPSSSRKVTDLKDLVQSLSEIKLQIPEDMTINPAAIMRIDKKGFLHIAMVPTYYIGVFDRTGRMIKRIGAQGFGPGELRRIQDFRIDSRGKIYVMDAITEEISIFDPDGKWIRNVSPHSRNNMSFEITSSGELVYFRRAYGENSFHLQVVESTNNKVVRELLPSSQESIRTHMLVSNSISSNEAGWILFAMMAARDIGIMSPNFELSKIPIDESRYKVSETKKLIQSYSLERTKGLVSKIFENSRVLSLGFLNEDVFAVSFATGRFEKTMFFVQFYSMKTRQAISRAFSTESPIYYLGNYYFGQWTQKISTLKNENDFNSTLRVFKFNLDRL